MLNDQTVAMIKPAAQPGAPATASGPVAPASSPASGPGDALVVVDLHKTYRSGFLKRRLRGVEGVSFAVPRGQVFALLGHNGAGKTTTINCVLDLVHPDAGEVRIFGRDHRQCASRRAVGYLPERPYFFEHLSGRELLRFYADLLDLPRAGRDADIDAVLARTGMAAHADRKLRKFSKGMLQRIGLAQTLLGDPELLILDEPMSGLDPMGRREVRELLLELKAQGKTIILSSHIVPDVEAVADTVAIMREGRLVETRNLHDYKAESSYGVHLGWREGAHDGARLPDWARRQIPAAGADRVSVEASDVDALRELLAACHAADVPVQAVDTRRTGLEDIFLAAHGHRSPVGIPGERAPRPQGDTEVVR
ncbi:ABC transporter ATP-binding protein [bacterium]|nr:ABC transporter ATP-binding protein [bacterium]